jgi:hypothetical protein
MIRHHRSLEGGDVDEERLAQDRLLQRKKAEAIFEQFCEAGASSLRFRDLGMSFTDPPEYDPELETIVSIATREDAVDVTTKHVNIKNSLNKYRLIDKYSKWIIRNKKYSFDMGKTWSKDYL